MGIVRTGTVASLFVCAGIFPAVSALVAALCYLSLIIASQDFLTFQWYALYFTYRRGTMSNSLLTVLNILFLHETPSCAVHVQHCSSNTHPGHRLRPSTHSYGRVVPKDMTFVPPFPPCLQ
jgi:hypothetical protein